ncbi:hypothetical protein GOV03_00255 [Candidatus Woesearchaeota archaeon]|nr:hypothetical protein [Candidatus Woesearchaeota archaeon]
MASKIEKIVAVTVAGILGLTVGTLGALGHLAQQDSIKVRRELESRFLMETRNYCEIPSYQASETAGENNDATMNLLLEEGKFCISDDTSILHRDIKLLEIYTEQAY